MPLTAGTRIAAYEITAPLGTGGMGEVYRARDTRLNREVAIKILPDTHASDPDRVSRFQREAQAIAALNHVAIAGIYDLAEVEGAKYLILELVEGETLAERLQRGTPRVDEALQIARQILEALEAAHEKGICHRDLKPANIKLTPEGAVKVLDFGLAKFLQTTATSVNLSHSPTMSLGTMPGMILGTAAYMSPEQAKGYEADQRSDIFSFGCIFYELLTGRQAFDGDTASEILASVLKVEVDLTRLPPRLNPRAVDLLRRCLEKNPKKRWHAAADVRVELESLGPPIVESTPQHAGASRGRWIAMLAGAALLSAAALAAWNMKPAPAAPVMRFSVPLADNERFTNTTRRFVGVSPDGQSIAYVVNSQLLVRELGVLEPRVINVEATAGATNPTFSPDGQSILFTLPPGVGSTGELRRVSVSGGAAVKIAQVDPVFGVTWDDNGILVGQGERGIKRVSPDGGTPELVIAAGEGEMLSSPQMLPDGRTLIYTVKSVGDAWTDARVVAQSPGGERKLIADTASDGRYLSSGHLVFARSGILLAARFDADNLATVGPVVPVVQGIRRTSSAQSSGSTQMSVSATGTLVYAPGPATIGGTVNALALFDRNGESQVLQLPPATYRSPRVSPDGKFIAVEAEASQEFSIWIHDVSGGSALRRLTFGGNARTPVWSPDAVWVAYQSDRDGRIAIYRQRADGSGAPERLIAPESGTSIVPHDWSPDGRHLLLGVRDKVFGLATFELATRTLTMLPDTETPGMVNGAFSPDGRWVAYQGRDGNANAVFVQSFPPTGAKFLLPQPGAGHPVWSPKGDEILVNWAPGSSAIIGVKTSPQFSFSPPREFPRRGRSEPNPGTQPTSVDFMPDGQRIVGVTEVGEAAERGDALVVVVNWFEELRQKTRVP